MNELLFNEENIENEIDNFKPVSDEKREKINGIIKHAKKNKAISLRIANHDLDMLKQMASKDGLPYQTLINSILHRYITHQLLDKDSVIKVIGSLNKK